jgi:hypothetical protein
MRVQVVQVGAEEREEALAVLPVAEELRAVEERVQRRPARAGGGKERWRGREGAAGLGSRGAPELRVDREGAAQRVHLATRGEAMSSGRQLKHVNRGA